MTKLDTTQVRRVAEDDIGPLAKLWYDGWYEAHAHLVPLELIRLRTLDSFRDRLRANLENVRAVGPPGAPLGFSMLRGNELYQLYVSRQARGGGMATALIADAEARLAEAGTETAILDCAIGNLRAARFYDKQGWHRTGTVAVHVETTEGDFPLEIWRYEKQLRGQ